MTRDLGHNDLLPTEINIIIIVFSESSGQIKMKTKDDRMQESTLPFQLEERLVYHFLSTGIYTVKCLYE